MTVLSLKRERVREREREREEKRKAGRREGRKEERKEKRKKGKEKNKMIKNNRKYIHQPHGYPNYRPISGTHLSLNTLYCHQT